LANGDQRSETGTHYIRKTEVRNNARVSGVDGAGATNDKQAAAYSQCVTRSRGRAIKSFGETATDAD